MPELLFSEIALHVCQKIGLDDRFTSLDTTSFSVGSVHSQLNNFYTSRAAMQSWPAAVMA
jgi:hypothetical protein